jgi:hypothetical protein
MEQAPPLFYNNYIATESFLTMTTHSFIAYGSYEPAESFVRGMGEISSFEHFKKFSGAAAR